MKPLFQKNDMLEVEVIFYISKCWKFPMLKVFYGGHRAPIFADFLQKWKKRLVWLLKKIETGAKSAVCTVHNSTLLLQFKMYYTITSMKRIAKILLLYW